MERSPPFSDTDLRLIVTQAIKTSSIPLQRLVELFDEHNTQPNWDKMELPYRRTIQECKDAFEKLRPSQPSPYPRQETPNPRKRPAGGALEPAPRGSEGSASKKRHSTILNTDKGTRDILPKPPSTGSSPSVASFPTTVQPPKRRGRPPKSEVERRQADAIRRGEVLSMTPLAPGPIHFTQAESHAMTSYAPIAPNLPPMHSPALSSDGGRIGNVPEPPAGPKSRPRSSPKTTKKEATLGPGENIFPANPQVSSPETREGPPPSAPRESMQAAPVTSRVESAPTAQVTPPAPPEEQPARTEPAPPRPPPDP